MCADYNSNVSGDGRQEPGFMTDFAAFLSWESTTRDVMDVKKIYFDIAGDIYAGLILAELIYWYLPNRNGESKLRIKRDGYDWIVVPRYEWWERCRLTPRQADRALATLRKAGLIVTERFRYDNSPTTHIRLNGTVFLERWRQLVKTPLKNPFLPNGENVNLPNGENANLPDGENARSHQTVKTMISPNGELEFTKRGELITETTTETTKTTESLAAPAGGERAAPEPDDPPPKRQTAQQVMFGAICEAWGYDPQTLTEDKAKQIGRVARQLVKAKAPPERMKAFKGWLDQWAERDQWKSYTVNAFAKYWPDFAAVLARNEERLRQAPPKRIPTLEDKMAKAAYYRWLCEQGRTDEALKVTFDDVWKLQETGQYPAGAQLG